MVHQAPGFGEDDFRVCLQHGVIQKGDQVICPVDASGRFTGEVHDFKGQHVKVSNEGEEGSGERQKKWEGGVVCSDNFHTHNSTFIE